MHRAHRARPRGVFELGGGAYYAARADDNADQAQATPAPRGIIYDAEGDPLVANKAVFDAVLDAHLFISDPSLQSSTLAAAQNILGIPSSTVWSLLDQSEAQDFSTPVVLAQDLNQSELVNLQALGASSTIKVQSDFERYYPNGPVFSSVVGYVGRVSQSDLAGDPKLTADDFVGKMGIEEEYDDGPAGYAGREYQIHRRVWEGAGRGTAIRFRHRRIGASDDRRWIADRDV